MTCWELLSYCLMTRGSMTSLGLLEAKPWCLLLCVWGMIYYFWTMFVYCCCCTTAFLTAPGMSLELMMKLLMSILTNPEAAFSWVSTTWEPPYVLIFLGLLPAVGADSAGLIRFLLITIWVVAAAEVAFCCFLSVRNPPPLLLLPSWCMNKFDYCCFGGAPPPFVVSRICTLVTGCLLFLWSTSVASSSLSEMSYYCLVVGSSRMISSSSKLSSIKSSTAISSRKSCSSKC